MAAPSAGLGAVIAAVSAERSCTTSFGAPVVPEVMSSHSVATRAGKASSIGTIDGAQPTRTGSASPGAAAVPSSITAASTSAAAITAPRCSASTSGGRMTRRRAMASSSISASAVVSWLVVANSTERPARSASRPARLIPGPRLVPRSRSVKRADAARSQRKPGALRFATECRSDGASTPAMFIDFHELAERHREKGVLGGGERIDAE